MITKIGSIQSITDEAGQYGPQKKIKLTDSAGRMMSGWIDLRDFNPATWVTGQSVDLEISQKGKYLNFKLPKNKANSSTPAQGGSDEVMQGLREIYKISLSIKRLVEQLTGPDTHVPKAPEYPEMPVWDTDESDRS